MMNSEQYREHIERTFNAFCKIVLYHAALNAYKKIRKKQQFEVSLDYLREFDFEPVTIADEYFVKYDVPTLLPFAGKLSSWKANSWQPRFCVCRKSDGKCCFCVTTSVTAIRKLESYSEFAGVQSSTDEKEHCASYEKKWRC